jgi:agmatine deiminase
VYCEIVRHLSRVERVHILIGDEEAEQRARKALVRTQVEIAAVDFFRCPTNRSWTRDYCPIFVRDERDRVVITDWQFNGWAKYDNWQLDNAVPSKIAKRLGLQRVEPKLVLEGGSIDVNGKGAMLTTRECLLSDIQQRNPGVSQSAIEAAFGEYLGITEVLWLNRGIAGDDTHGHVDDIARFVDASTIVAAEERDRSEVNYEPLKENLRLLRKTSMRIVTLPMPEPVYFDGQRLPASYANFYIANGSVLVPTFNDVNDRAALATLAKCFPEHEVVGIHAVDLVLGLGTLHCMTQQQIAETHGS